MGLHLGAEFALDNDVGLREALRDVAADGARRSRAHCRSASVRAGAGQPEGWPAGAEASSCTDGASGARALSMSTTNGSAS